MLGKERHSSSMRLQSYPAHYALLEAGIESHLTYVGDPDIWPELPRDINPEQELKGAQIVVIAKSIEGVARQYALAAKKQGSILITQLGTNGIMLEFDNYQPLDISDWIVAPFLNKRTSQRIKQLNPLLAHQPLIIPDPIETWLPKTEDCTDNSQHIKTVLWIGRKRHLASLKSLQKAIPDDWKLITISDTQETDYYWDPQLAASLLASCQALTITNDYDPYDPRTGNSSPIRMLNGLACGKPVLAPPCDAYLATSPDQQGWIACLNGNDYHQALVKLSDPIVRQQYSQQGLAVFKAIQKTDPAAQWRQLIKELLI